MTLHKASVVLVLLAVNLSMPAECRAAVNGDCSTCHTMHNSQQGSAVAYLLDNTGKKVTMEIPLANLLKTDCLGCHSNVSGETITTLDESSIPIVFNILEPLYPPDGSSNSTLAGGNFHWLMARGDAYGHNVSGITGEDLRFPPTLAPGGVSRTGGECQNCHGTLASAGSGCEGCHVPQHHADSEDIVVGREQGWYRFLGSVMQRDDYNGPTPEGVVGIEAQDWEQNPLPMQHNTYQGAPGPFVSYLESGSISQKCAGCHGVFHNETIASSTWIRHPVDVAIPDTGEFTALVSYNPLIPVARQGVQPEDAGFSVVNRGSDMVSCISCHRPHGSPYPAMLRWGYRDWPGEDSHTLQPALNGCAVCHTSKS